WPGVVTNSLSLHVMTSPVSTLINLRHKDVLILVFLEDIPAKQLSPYYQIRSLVKRSSYLSWPQAGQHTGVFWQKIQQALSREENPAERTCLLNGHQRVIQ
uniref:TIR domain-containing protein n=1 Tax=Neolamprologus brichardi TaxID=32507 RepID=A0A3Q4FZ76_NEOBR